MCVLKVKIMFPFKLGDFLGKLMHVELKRYFPKKCVIYSGFLQRTLGITDIIRFIEVRIATMHLPDKLTEHNSVRPLGTGWSKGGLRPSFCKLPRKAFYLSPINFGIHPNRFTIFISANNKVTPVKETPLPLINNMDSVIKIYEPAMTMVKTSGIKPEQTPEVEADIDMRGVVEPEKGFNNSLFDFEKSITEIFYWLFNKPVAIQLPKAIMIPITA